MAQKRRKANEPVPEQLANADPGPVSNNDQDDGENEENDKDEVVVHLGVSFMASTPSPPRRKKSEREARRCSSHLMQFPITKIVRDKIVSSKISSSKSGR